MAIWYTVDEARDEWPDAPVDYGDGGDNTLTQLLTVARDAVLAYAPAGSDPSYAQDADGYIVEVPDSIPDGYRQAQLLQARNIWNSTKANSSGDVDGGQYGIAVGFPLDWQVRQLIRPKTGKPWIG